MAAAQRMTDPPFSIRGRATAKSGMSSSSVAAQPGWAPRSNPRPGATARFCSSRATSRGHLQPLDQAGGVRYLQQGNVSLVMESLKERGRLIANAPHVAHNLPFVVPVHK